MVKRFLLIPLLVLVISGLMLIGCPAPPAEEPTVEEPAVPTAEEPVVEEPAVEEPAVEKSVLRVGLHQGPVNAHTNPFATVSATDFACMTLIYEPLWIPTLEGEVVPWLAKRWEYKEDEKAWVIQLDERATWSDGEPVTAEDVKFTLGAYLEYNFMFGTPIQPSLDSIVVVDDHMVRFNMKEDYAHFIAQLSGVFIMPEHIWSEIGEIDLYENANPVGSGPFLFKEYVPRQYFHVVKNPSYWRGPVDVDEVLNLVYTDESARQMALLKGEIDVLPYFRGVFALVPDFKADPDIEYYELPGPYIQNFLVNYRTYPLNLKEVRHAISLAIDREPIVERAYGGFATYPLMGFVPPAHAYYADTSLTWPGLDMTEEERIAEANAMLDDLGFMPGADGIRVTDRGERMEFRDVLPNYTSSVRGAELIKRDLEKIGIATKILAMDSATAYTKIMYSGKNFEDWDFFGPSESTVRGLEYICTSWAPEQYNRWMNSIATGFEDQEEHGEIQSLLWQVNKVMDVEKQREPMMQFQKVFAEMLVSIVLGHRYEVYAYRTDKFTGWYNTLIMQGNLPSPSSSLLNLTSLHPK